MAGVFEEGVYNSPGGDLPELKNYVIGRLLRDVTLDPDQLVDEFLDGYYGPGAASVRSYMSEMETSVDDANYSLGGADACLACSLLTTDLHAHAPPALRPIGVTAAPAPPFLRHLPY